MSKDFAMMKAARRLENYLSRERYNLNKMQENQRVSDSLMQSKVEHYNELVATLNDLFGVMTNSSDLLFDPYLMDEDEVFEPVILSSYEPTPTVIQQPEPESVPGRQEPEAETIVPDMVDIRDNTDSPEEPLWRLAGYESEQAWIADKESEAAEINNDLSVSVNVGLAQHRADQVLNEYNQTAEQDIDSYMPEDDKPVSVLPSDVEDEDDNDTNTRPTSDLNYLHHTEDGVRVDNDPTQIASVRTAVERDGAAGNKGTDIDVSSYSYNAGSSVISNLIDDDLENLHINRVTVPDYEDSDSADDDGSDADNEI